MKPAVPRIEDDMVGRLVLGRYRIVRLLAQGGMGSIYLARNKGAAGFVRPAVVKQILPSYLGNDQAVQMFAREARIMSNLRHPGIVHIIDFAEEDGAYVMVLEYVHGTHAGRWIRYLRKLARPFPIDLALQIMIHTLDALEYAHSATALDGTPLQIVHRDIKPSNILIDVAGHVKLADFGIARAPNDRTEISAGTTKLKGTFPYLAPEVFDDIEPSASTDVYACGVVLHTLLTGRNEFAAKEVSTTIMRVMEHVPTPLTEARSDVSEALSRVVARSMAKDPEERFKTAAELAGALRALRQLTEAEANDLLRTSAAIDLRDPRFAQLLEIDDLFQLERSLTSDGDPLDPNDSMSLAGGTELATDPAPNTGSELTVSERPPTGAGRQRSRANSSSRPRARRWPIFAVAVSVAVIVGGGIAAFGLVLGKAREPGQVVIIDQSGSLRRPSEGRDVPSEEAIQAVEPADADEDETPDPGGESAAPPSPPERPARKRNVQEQIDTALSRRGAQFQACFQSHPAQSEKVSEVKIAFQVDARGKVSSAKLEDRALASSELGTCLVSVARATRFGAMDEPIGFKVPIKTHRQ